MFIVIEAHCVLDWGEHFRPDFKKLFQLRSIFPHCIMLALSATVTRVGQEQNAKTLHMEGYEVVCFCLARLNIFLHVEKRPSPTAKGNTAETPYRHIFFLPIFIQMKEQDDSGAGPDGGGGGGGQGFWILLENDKSIGFLSNTDPLNNNKYFKRAFNVLCWAIIGPPAKRHLLAGRN